MGRQGRVLLARHIGEEQDVESPHSLAVRQGQGDGQQDDEDGGRQVGPPDHEGAPEDAVTVPHLRFRVPGDFHDPRDRIGALVGAHVGHPFSVVTGALTVSRRSVGSPSPTPMGGVSGLWPAS